MSLDHMRSQLRIPIDPSGGDTPDDNDKWRTIRCHKTPYEVLGMLAAREILMRGSKVSMNDMLEAVLLIAGPAIEKAMIDHVSIIQLGKNTGGMVDGPSRHTH